MNSETKKDQIMQENVAIQESITIPPTWLQSFWNRNSALLKLTGMIGILLFAFWVGMDPHWDYKYPLHVDEWFAMGYTDAMMEEGSLTYSEPYHHGQEVSNHQEMGFHLLLGSLKIVTDTSWMDFYRVAPGFMFALLAFAVYALGRSDGFGWAAALFVVLIPTSIRTLGPTFVVPVSIGLLFVVVTLLVIYRLGEKCNGKQLWLLLLLIGGLVFVHAPTAGLITALVILYLVASVIEALITGCYRMAVNMVVRIAVVTIIPLILTMLWLPSRTREILTASFSGDSEGMTGFLGFHYGFHEVFGDVAVSLFVFGFIVFMLNRPYGIRTYILPVSTVLLILFLYIVYPRYLLGPSILYERGWSYLGLFGVILAGYGISYWLQVFGDKRAGGLGLRWQRDVAMRMVLAGVGFGALVATLTIGLGNEEREDYTGYYHVMDDQVYTDFVWLGQNTDEGHKMVMMEPSLAWTYPPVAGAGNRVYDVSASPWSQPWAEEMREILATGSVDVAWLLGRDILVWYTGWPEGQRFPEVNNSGLAKVRPNVYVVTDY